MSPLSRLSVAVVLALAFARCTQEPPPPEPDPLIVTSDQEQVAADGTASVLISVTGAKAPVRLTATQGTWLGTGKALSSLEGDGSLRLVTCDSRQSSTCAAKVRVNAVAEDGATGSVFVTFGQLEICGKQGDEDGNGKADCEDTAVCLDQTCMLPEGSVGTGVCSNEGGDARCVCETGADEVCTDGMDNNCDGKIDCGDSSCGNKVCTLVTGANGMCVAGTCKCPGTAEICGNGVDDDCDLKVDCGDTDCQATSSAAGKKCDDAKGLLCSAPDNTGAATCSVCPGPEAGGEVTCNDGKDNDCDGLVDCADADCADDACGTNGKVCNGTTMACGCSGNGGTPEDGRELSCDDGFDNDCDGLSDCQDPDCAAQTCGANGKTCNAQKSCVCGGNGGAAQTAETTCNDGADNDCDGLVDCAETDCRPQGNQLGKVCDANKNTCSPPINGVSTCSVCSGGGGVAQAVESYCFDNSDNDCDGLTDCQDPDCTGTLCSATGKLCTATFTCECAGGSPETNCADGLDNDCDGTADCQDTDCRPASGSTRTCGPNGMTCTAAGACGCSGNGGAAQTAETSCGDGVDNDCDGFADCQDVQCRPTTVGGTNGKDCSNPTGPNPTFGMKCDAVGQCLCPNGQSTETFCGDLVDNDCDGLLDCQDPDCDSVSCGSFGQECVYASRTCVCPGGSTEICSDLIDNNCNGKVDCEEPAIAGGQAPCANAVCNSNPNYQCTLTGQSYVCKDITTNISLTLAAAPIRLAANGTSPATVTLTLKDGNTALGNKQVTLAVTSGAGSVSPSTVITNSLGQATVTYTAGTQGGFNVVTATYFTGTQDVTGTVAIETPAVGQVRFDSQQNSIMGVRFSSFQEVNDITFQVLDTNNQPYPPGLTVTFTHTPVGGSYIGSTPNNCTQSLCTTTGVTNAQGKVKVSLRSGTVASVVSVVANVSAGGGSGNATASNIAIVGAKASGSNISISCTPRNVPALSVHDCTSSQYNATINCTAAFADRFNNILGVGTIATFKSEAGAATATSQSSPSTGLAKVGVSVQGFRLPVDVVPVLGEHALSYDSGCGVKTHNPRDGLATIIVSANGEEGFVDGSNGQPANGVFDPGENFIDMGEPYVDANDNGVRDANEDYVDFNNNGSWDGPNGTWDSNTFIWAETRVLYTGRAHLAYTAGGEYTVSRWFDPILPADPPIAAPAVPPSFAVNSTKATGGATTQTLGVYFADKNFNQLTTSTAYGVSVVSGTATTRFLTPPSVVDNLGMNFTQQFCSTSTGGTCSNTCQSSPCYVVTTVNGFAYGNYGVVEIKGGSDASTAEVRATSTFGGVQTQMSVTGTVSN